LVLALAVTVPTLLPLTAGAEPIRLKSPATCTTEAGSTVELPPGVFLSADLWIKLELETQRLQEIEIRLTAENDSLRKSLSVTDSTFTITAAAIAGIIFGKFVL